MRTIGNDLKNHLAAETTKIALCWKLTLNDSPATVIGFTNHDKTLTVGGVSYDPARGMSSTSSTTTGDLNVDNYDVTAFLESDQITEADLIAGVYDYAEIESFIVNWSDVSQGTMTIAKGRLGEVTIKNGEFIAEVRSLSQNLHQTIGKRYSRSCRAELGDSECQINLASYTVTGTVTSVDSRRQFADSSRAESEGEFNYGKLTWTSGSNNGLSIEVKTYTLSPHSFILFDSMPYDIQVGDNYSVYSGCDKLFATCRDTFDNVINFRGEPHIPGIDEILRTPTTK